MTDQYSHVGIEEKRAAVGAALRLIRGGRTDAGPTPNGTSSGAPAPALDVADGKR